MILRTPRATQVALVQYCRAVHAGLVGGLLSRPLAAVAPTLLVDAVPGHHRSTVLTGLLSWQQEFCKQCLLCTRVRAWRWRMQYCATSCKERIGTGWRMQASDKKVATYSRSFSSFQLECNAST
jgi:hypothetical protein